MLVSRVGVSIHTAQLPNGETNLLINKKNDYAGNKAKEKLAFQFNSFFWLFFLVI